MKTVTHFNQIPKPYVRSFSFISTDHGLNGAASKLAKILYIGLL